MVPAAPGGPLIEKWRRIERTIIIGSRFLTGAAVLGSLLGSVLMLFLGVQDIYDAYVHGIAGSAGRSGIPADAAAVISVIEALDRFLISLVLLYFAYGVYSLFIHPEIDARTAAEEVSLPAWMRVKQIGQLKQVVAEVIIVILFVLFLRNALQVFQSGEVVTLGWEQIATLALLPLCIMLLAIALRLIELYPKPARILMSDDVSTNPGGERGTEADDGPP